MSRAKTRTKQETILEAASHVFAAKEFHQVLVDEVAAEAGIGKGTVYRYFQTKEDLYFSTILRGLDRLHEILSAALPQEPSPVRRLEQIARETLSFFWNKRSLLMLLYREERRMTARREEFRTRRDRILRLVQEALLQGIERREFRGVEARIGAEMFLGMIRGVNLFRREEDKLDALVSEVMAVFTHGIARKET
jgi:AcrR family transcriptional regulator